MRAGALGIGGLHGVVGATAAVGDYLDDIKPDNKQANIGWLLLPPVAYARVVMRIGLKNMRPSVNLAIGLLTPLAIFQSMGYI